MIYDIFSKKKIKSKKESKEKIIVDFREKNSLVPAKLISLGAKIEFKELEVGDYIIKDIIVERKEFKDFISSIKDLRLKNQIKNLKKYENKLTIIEGKENALRINENSLRGAILSTTLVHKIPIIFTEDPEETAKYLLQISKRKTKEGFINPQRTKLTQEERKLFILESFEGIGPATAKKLLNKFKTLDKIFNAPSEELEPILKSKTKKFMEQIKE